MLTLVKLFGAILKVKVAFTCQWCVRRALNLKESFLIHIRFSFPFYFFYFFEMVLSKKRKEKSHQGRKIETMTKEMLL
jgi:hypothetical protein